MSTVVFQVCTLYLQSLSLAPSIRVEKRGAGGGDVKMVDGAQETCDQTKGFESWTFLGALQQQLYTFVADVSIQDGIPNPPLKKARYKMKMEKKTERERWGSQGTSAESLS